MLEEIYMDDNEIDAQMLEKFSKAVKKLTKLVKIGICYNKLDASSINIIKNMLENPEIKELYITGINITEEEADNLISEFITINIRI